MGQENTVVFKQRGNLFEKLFKMRMSSIMIEQVSKHLGRFKDTQKIEAEAERLFELFKKCQNEEEMEELIWSL